MLRKKEMKGRELGISAAHFNRISFVKFDMVTRNDRLAKEKKPSTNIA